MAANGRGGCHLSDFFNESHPKGNFIQHHVLHVVPRFSISDNFYAAELHVLNHTEAMKQTHSCGCFFYTILSNLS